MGWSTSTGWTLTAPWQHHLQVDSGADGDSHDHHIPQQEALCLYVSSLILSELFASASILEDFFEEEEGEKEGEEEGLVTLLA